MPHHLDETEKQHALEEAEKHKPRPKKRTTTGLKLTEGAWNDRTWHQGV
jgi:hypothetical protein